MLPSNLYALLDSIDEIDTQHFELSEEARQAYEYAEDNDNNPIVTM